MGNQIVTFQLGKEIFGIDTNLIKEIIRYPEITEVPKAPKYLKGLANLRGIIIPVIDTRIKLDIPDIEITPYTRVLILDMGKTFLGLIVDQVKGVIDVEENEIEPPPQVLSSEIEKEYISGVIRKNGQLILKLNLENLCKIKITASEAEIKTQVFKEEQKEEEKKYIEEIQLVTFLIAEEEYAFPIEIVKEILRVGNITEVPETPEYILGILAVRDTLLPVVDLRKIFGFSDLAKDVNQELDKILKEHEDFVKDLKNSIETGSPFRCELDHNKCGFGLWMKKFITSSEKINQAIESMKKDHQLFHELAKIILQKVKEHNKDSALQLFENDIVPVFEKLKEHFKNLKEAISEDIKEDQRILVLEIFNTPIGILVDRIKQVIRVPKDSIEKPPEILKTEKSDNLKGIAKLEEGKRIIMLISEESLFDKKTIEELKEMVKKEEKLKKETTIVTEEIQLVTFKLAEVDFAVPIEDVQEINRVESITSVPRAPYFVEGVMNLRGNVIPVIDLRKRFEMEFRPYDETTKVIIVKLQEKLVGFVVDSVSEVLRVSKDSLETPPEIIAENIDTRFIKAICKLEEKNKIILVIDILNVLSYEEKEKLETLMSSEETIVSEPSSEKKLKENT
ncbi:MAG: Chemotaxis signal transduction protein CheW [Thermodesulfobacteria bacterium]|nr:chemotaxis protein CheW [Thermodesulfobacteriota bacterium]MCU4138297.1 Chemotaxis signal transduction protein CheW [Thermodesulfobacteriota bacterium]